MNIERLLEAWDAASVRCLAIVLHFLWQGAALALLTGVGLLCLRRAMPRPAMVRPSPVFS